MSRVVLLVTAIGLLLTVSFGAAQATTELTVYAAASLTDVFEALADSFEAQTDGVSVIFNFASSSQLAAQIAEGAPADVFASADVRQMRAAQATGRIDIGTDQVFARNRLVVITPVDNPAELNTVRDLAVDGLHFVMAAEGVPARGYADVLLTRLGSVYGRAWVDAVYANLVSEEENVRQTLVRVALGEADAGIVYYTDALSESESVSVIEVPRGANVLAAYPIAIVNDSPNVNFAQAWVDFVLSAAGQRILESAGFVRIDD